MTHTRTDALAVVITAILSHLGLMYGKDYDLETSLATMKADSLDLVQITILVENGMVEGALRTGWATADFKFPDDLSQFKTVEDVVRFVENYE